MYKRILMATDGSDAANRALDEAVRLSKEQGAALRIVHVILEQRFHGGHVGLSNWQGFLEALRVDGQTLVKAAAERALAAGIKAETDVLLEPDRRIADVILEAGVHWSAELIVLGTHGRHGLGHLFLGSVAEEVIRASSVPVLTMHHV